MNTENSNANESKKFICQFSDKLNLKNPSNKNIGLVNLSITSGKTLNRHITTITLKFQLQLGTMNLNCLMALIQFLILRIILSLSSKNTKPWLKILPYKVTPTKSKTGSFLR